jgi:hypothetical protein
MARPCGRRTRADGVCERVPTPTNALEKARPASVAALPSPCGPRGRAVGARARERAQDEVQRLHAERVGVRRGEDRHAASSAWVSASTPVSAVSERGIVSVSAGRRRHVGTSE